MKTHEHIVTELDQRVASLTQVLASGSVMSWENYHRLTGEIRGLSLAKELINDLVRRVESNDD